MQETNNSQNQKNTPQVVGFKRAVPIILFALAAFIALCFITQSTGWLGTFISNVFLGLFSYGAYAIPLLLIIHGIFFFRDIENKCVLSRAIFSVITVITISALSYTIAYYGEDVGFAIKDYYRLGVEGVGGGFIGSIISFVLMKVFGSVGMIVIAVAIFALYISFFFAKSKRISGKFLYFLLAVLTSILALIEKLVMFIVKKIKGVKQRKLREEIESKNEEFFGDDFFAVDNGLKELKIAELGIKETRSTASIEANPTLHEKVFHKSAVDDAYESVRQSEKVSEDSYISSGEKRKRSASFYDASKAIIIEETEIKDKSSYVPEVEKKEAAPQSLNRMYGLDENAEDVFTSDFDPFDFVMGETLASKPSSKAELINQERGISKTEESISNITEEDIKRARDLERFEASKRAAIERMRRTATPVTSSPANIPAETKSVEINVAGSEKVESNLSGKAYSVTIDKLEAQMSRQNIQNIQNNENNSLHYEQSSVPYTPACEKNPTPVVEECIDEQDQSINVTQEMYSDQKDSYIEEDPYQQEFIFESEAAANELTDPIPDNSCIQEDTEPQEAAYAQENNYSPDNAYTQENNCSPDNAYTQENNYSSDNAYTQESNYISYGATADSGYGTYEKDQDPIFGVSEDEAEAASVSSDNNYELFAPIDYSDDEDTLDNDESELFKPYTEPSADDFKSTQDIGVHRDVLVTERSMLNPSVSNDDIYDSDEEELDGEEHYNDEGYEPEIIPENERNPEVERLREMFPFLNSTEEDSEEEGDDVPPFESDYQPILQKEMPEVKKPEPKKPEQPKKDEPKKPDFKNYVFPPIDLLVKDDLPVQSNDEEIQENANKLIETLGSFNVTVTIKGYDRGPRITRYEVVPAAGVKVTQVTNLENDVALALAAGSLRVEAPIPGKSAIGFEIPNKHAETVRLRDLIETNEFASSDKHTTICVGKDVSGCPVISTVEKMPHVLVAGATGMGKSVCINALLVSMIYKASPADVRFIMIDPKKVEFNMYEGIPHLLVPIVTDSKKAAGALMWAVEEMERRYDLISKNNVRNIDSYNEKVEKNPDVGEKLARIIIVIDEFADLMLQVRDPVENLVMSLAQKARAAGIHLIIGTQKPTTNVITGVIKSNIPARISCRVSSNVDSRIVLDQSGAEKLLAKGDMLFYLPGMMKPIRTQGALVSDSEINDIMEFLRQGTDGPTYDNEVLDKINNAAQKCSKNSQNDSDYDDDDERSSGEGYLNDRKFLEAVELAVNTGSIATSKLQRKMSIGFGKAAQFIDIMEDLGIVGPPNGPKAREVLMSADEWHEKLARTQLDD